MISPEYGMSGKSTYLSYLASGLLPARYVDIAVTWLSRLSQELGTVLFDAGMGT